MNLKPRADYFLLFLLALTPIRPIPAEPPPPTVTLPLWPDGKMPGHGADQPEKEDPARGDNVQRITDVSQPTLNVMRAPGDGPAPAMIVCPGGAYGLLSYDLEGTEIGTWLNSLGITALVLKYRVPNNRDGAFQDVQRAVRLARLHGGDWKIDPDKLGIIGFSAGGHLAARLSTNFAQSAYPDIDATDHLSCQPNFTILVYPAYLEVNGQLPAELPVTGTVPRTLIVHTEDDRKYVVGSKVYHAALDAAHVPNEFLLYQTGGHGYGLRCKKEAAIWPKQAAEWLQQIGILSASTSARPQNTSPAVKPISQ